MKKKNINEFSCLDQRVTLAVYGIIVFALCGFLGTNIAVIVGLINGLKFMPDGLGYLVSFSLPMLIVVILLFGSVYGTKQGVFKINEEFCTLKSKFKGETIDIKLNTTEIQRIEIMDFSKTHRAICIVLIDGKGTYGNIAYTKRNDEYIKLQYTKRRLKKIKGFLPDCLVLFKCYV